MVKGQFTDISADFVGEKVQYQQHRSKELVSFYGSVAFIYELFRSHDFQPKRQVFLKKVENHKELDHRTQVFTKNICQALLSF
jgi:hypothetical protein